MRTCMRSHSLSRCVGTALLALFSLMALWTVDAHAQAQEPPEPAGQRPTIVVIPPDEVGVEDYGALVRRAAGDAQADVTDYGALAEAEGSMLDRTHTGVATFGDKLKAKIHAVPQAWSNMLTTLDAASPTGEAEYFTWIFVVIGGGLVAGFLVEWLIYGIRIVGPWFIAQQIEHPMGYVDKLPILAIRVLLTVGGVAVSTAVAALTGFALLEANGPTQKTAIVIFATYVVIRIIVAIWRMILSPYLSNYRIPALSDGDAVSLFRWMSLGGIFGLTSLAFCIWMDALGLPHETHALLTSALTLITVLINLAMIRANHRAISQTILGGRGEERAGVVSSMAARLWAPLASAYFIFAWAMLTYRLILDLPLGVPLIAGAYTVLSVVLVVYAGVSYVIEWAFRRQHAIREINRLAEEAEERETASRVSGSGSADIDGDGDAAAGPPPPPSQFRRAIGYRMITMEDLARRVASVLAVAAGFWSLLWIWDANTMMDESFLIARLFDVSVTAFLGYIAYHGVRIGIDQRIEEEGGAEVEVQPGDEGGGAGAASRLATLLPLFRNFLLVFIAIVTIMMMLVSSGFNVTAVFAGAGVVGIAIGFGAQTLVRDIFSGMFFLIDDAFRKGEYIDIGSVKGTVEKISLRSFQLRHHLGMLHTIPFGEIQFLTNFSRDWVMMKLPLRLTYDTDVEKVRKLIKTLGQMLQADPDLGPKFLQPLKSQGVYQMEESAMIIRVKFMTRPGEQWVIRKRIYAEIRELFEREGIKFAHREVTVHVADDRPNPEPLTEDQKKAVAGAVRPILDPPAEGRQMALQDDR
ncbi:MAG: mechanosensitive ion channel family protein [Rhodobacteraceae bacterium]|nr:mechanosensitive ion channel family protein [Paracoccaceae bacterium]